MSMLAKPTELDETPEITQHADCVAQTDTADDSRDTRARAQVDDTDESIEKQFDNLNINAQLNTEASSATAQHSTTTEHSLTSTSELESGTDMPILPANYVPASSSTPQNSLTTVVPPPPHHLFNTDPPYHSSSPSLQTYLIIGASRGIGLAFVRALIAQNQQVIAVVRHQNTASQLWQVMSTCPRPHQCIIKQCDITDPASIDTFIADMRNYVNNGGKIDNIILNAGILRYNEGIGAMNVSFQELTAHLTTNCTGVVVTARKLLELNDLGIVQQRRQHSYNQTSDTVVDVIGRQVVFISSDSGSMADFREYEDGFAAYAASKAALNMMIRHMAAELKRVKDGTSTAHKQNANLAPQMYNTSLPTPSPEQNAFLQTRSRHPSTSTLSSTSSQHDLNSRAKRIRLDDPRPTPPSNPLPSWQSQICVLAMHPGEVQTDMANIDLPYEVEGVISAEESVACMLKVLRAKGVSESGSFWRWDGDRHPW